MATSGRVGRRPAPRHRPRLFGGVYDLETYGWNVAPVHDAVAVTRVIRAELAAAADANVDVPLLSDLCNDHTVVERYRDGFFGRLVDRTGPLS